MITSDAIQLERNPRAVYGSIMLPLAFARSIRCARRGHRQAFAPETMVQRRGPARGRRQRAWFGVQITKLRQGERAEVDQGATALTLNDRLDDLFPVLA